MTHWARIAVLILFLPSCSGTGADAVDLRATGQDTDLSRAVDAFVDAGGTVPDQVPADTQYDQLRAPADALPELPDVPRAEETVTDDGYDETAAIDIVWPDLPPDLPPCFPDEPAPLTGRLYYDGDQSSTSLHAQGYYPKFDDPIGGWTISLYSPSMETSQTSCYDGTYRFEALPEQSFLVEVDYPKQADCTSNNLPRRFPKAVREGHVTIVTIGDSVPKVGNAPRFPQRLADKVSALADVTNLNLAVSGTTTQHWLPGGYHFEQILEPALPEADVVIISIGGNDVMGYIGGAMGNPYDLLKKVEGLDEFTTKIHDSVALIINEIKARYEDVDVVFCLYVNYAQSTYWSSQAGPYKSLFISTGHNALVKARGLLASMNYVLIADMFGALGDTNVDPYLVDSVHLSTLGHELYAEQLFLTLGGVDVVADGEPLERLFGFAW